jgi:hypothetical protein
MAKLYRGDPKDDSLQNVRVYDNGSFYPLTLRLDLQNHSPTGFAWGYGGSGPHQLALALLSDATGDDRLAINYYRHYVVDVISTLDMDQPFEVSQVSILAWLKAKRRELT